MKTIVITRNNGKKINQAVCSMFEFRMEKCGISEGYLSADKLEYTITGESKKVDEFVRYSEENYSDYTIKERSANNNWTEYDARTSWSEIVW